MAMVAGDRVKFFADRWISLELSFVGVWSLAVGFEVFGNSGVFIPSPSQVKLPKRLTSSDELSVRLTGHRRPNSACAKR